MKKLSPDLNILLNSHDTTEDSSKHCRENNFEKNSVLSSKASSVAKYNNGRWTQTEHKKFIEAILKYGNEWKNIKEFIGSRSSTQARSHAQKFFIRIKKKLFDNKLNVKMPNSDKSSYANIISCFQDCVPSKKINLEESDKLMKLILSLMEESNEEKDFKFMKNYKNGNIKKKKLIKNRFLIKKIRKNDENDLISKDNFLDLNSRITDSEIKNNMSINLLKDNLMIFRKLKFKTKNKIKIGIRKKYKFNQIQELKSNLETIQIDNKNLNDNNQNDPQIFKNANIFSSLYSDFYVKKINNTQNYGVYDDLKEYYKQLFESQSLQLNNNDLDNNIPIEHINIESMFNADNLY